MDKYYVRYFNEKGHLSYELVYASSRSEAIEKFKSSNPGVKVHDAYKHPGGKNPDHE